MAGRARGRYDAVVVGSGPNGLAAAVVCAQAGWKVLVCEAEAEVGGGARSAELTLPGYVHDVCSAVHPMAVATRFLRSLPLDRFGLEWIHPPLALAHPLEGGGVAALYHSLDATMEGLGGDGGAYQALIGPVVRNWEGIEAGALGPLRLPRHPLQVSAFGWAALRPAAGMARAKFRTEGGRALFAGLAAHSAVPLSEWGSSAIALVLAAAAHRADWPIAKGGSQAIAKALAGYLQSLGGEIETGRRIEDIADLPPTNVGLFDVAPANLLKICGQLVPAATRRGYERYQAGPGVFKMDWALRGPIPWRSDKCRVSGTVHVGGTLEEVESAEGRACAARGGEPPERPFVLVSQPSRFDRTRVPGEGETAWGYCHVPNGCTTDMTERIEAQIERFAPGFRSLIVARATRSPRQAEVDNANLIGGDITGGRNSLRQILLRPTWRGYRTGMRGIYICSASTPPGGGVHGLCGYFAAQRALREHRK